MIHVYKSDVLIESLEDDTEGRTRAARLVGKESGGIRMRGGSYKKGEWEVVRDPKQQRVFKFGLLPPTHNAELVEEQMRAAHRYRNKLTEIEIDWRKAWKESTAGHPDLSALKEDLAQLTEDVKRQQQHIKSVRKASRARSEYDHEREHLATLKAKKKEAAARLKEAKRALREDPEVKAARRAAFEQANDRRKRARAESGVFWGTYLLMEDAADRASKDARRDPKFMRWTGAGRIGVQLQKKPGIDAVSAGESGFLQIDPVPREAWESPVRGERRRLARTKVRLRIGSDGRKPVWAEWPMVMHRPLPEGSKVQWAVVKKTRDDCRRWRWTLYIWAEFEGAHTDTPEPEAESVAVSTETVRDGDSLRAGTWVGSDGEWSKMWVPDDVERDLEKAEKIRSLRDEKLEDMKAYMGAWLRETETPEWLTEAAAFLPQWRSASRFAALAKRWRHNRFEGDTAGYECIESWRYRDEHLERMESGVRRKALGRRKEYYRILAAKLSRKYGRLLLAKREKAEARKHPGTESPRPKMSGYVRAQNRVAAYELEEALRNAFSARWREVCERSADGDSPATSRARDSRAKEVKPSGGKPKKARRSGGARKAARKTPRRNES